MNPHDIGVGFCIWSLFFPRLTLLWNYCFNQIPHNTIPFWGDFFMALFIPRILVLCYIGMNLGVTSVWFIIHAIILAALYLSAAARIAASRS